MLSWFVSLQIPIGAGFSVLPTILLLADARLFLHFNFSPLAIPLPPPLNTQNNPITTTSGNKLLLKAQVQCRKTAALKKNLSLGIKQLCSGSFSVLHRRFLLAVFIFFLSSQQFSMLLYPTRFFYHPLFSHWAESPHYLSTNIQPKKTHIPSILLHKAIQQFTLHLLLQIIPRDITFIYLFFYQHCLFVIFLNKILFLGSTGSFEDTGVL